MSDVDQEILIEQNRILADFSEQIVLLVSERDAARAEVERLTCAAQGSAALGERLAAVLGKVAPHLDELRGAWERGAIREIDGLGGTRSNRNFDLWVATNTTLAAWKESRA